MEVRKALIKRRHVFGIAAAIALLAALVPIAVLADDTTATSAAGVAADTVWVIVAACFVMFMQAGFAMLEVGFSRMKNVGTVVAKVITNLSVSSIAYWGVGFGLAFGAGGAFALIGGSGFFPTFSPGSSMDLPAIAASTVPAAGKWFFEFVFCAVSLAIVWGTMLERTKFIVYIL
ncbi:MAG: ammonium transporter, partial [Chloroflexi bacterium]